jgi:ribosomal protein S12 methylthiotransferase accessory factor YcaO
VRAALLAYVGELADPRAAVHEPTTGVVPPGEFVTASGLPVDRYRVRDWLAARSLRTGDRHLVPAAAVYPLAPANADRLFERTTAGDGAGATPAEAVRAGLLSALAYEALHAAALGAVGHPVPVGPARTGSELEFLLRTLDTFGMTVDVVDLSPGRPYHVMLARATGPADAPLWSIGASLLGRRAVVDALRDLVGVEQLRRALGPDVEVDLGGRLLPDLDPRALRRAATTSPEVMDGPDVLDAPAGTAGELVADLASRGIDPLVIHTTTPELAAYGGVVTARVLLRRSPCPI